MNDNNIYKKNHRFRKKEKLKSRKQIGLLFKKGKSITESPVQAVFLIQKKGLHEVKSGFSVSKKLHKSAVDRNLLKRRMREAYRINKSNLDLLTRSKGLSLSVMFIYKSHEKVPFSKIQQKILIILQRLEVNITNFNHTKTNLT